MIPTPEWIATSIFLISMAQSFGVQQVARTVYKHGMPCGGVRAAYKAINFDNLVDWVDAIK